MTTNFIIWNVDPISFVIPEWFPLIGGRPIAWYGIIWAAVFVIGFFIMKIIYRKEKIQADYLDKLFVYMIISSIIGARLGHCLFYDPAYYFSNPIKFLAVWEGGLASHGGAIGILIGLCLYSKKTKLPYIWILDRIVIPVALAGALIRFGNLLNSEIYGTPTDMPWGFKFVRDYPIGTPIENIPACHPTQIYESLFCIFTFAYLLFAYFKQDMGKRYPGLMFSIFLIVIFGSRIIIEFIKNPQVEAELQMTFDIGQWLSFPFILIGVIMMVMSLKGKFRPKS